MPTPAFADEHLQRLTQTTQQLYRHCTLEQFPKQALLALRDLVDTDHNSYNAMDPERHRLMAISDGRDQIVQRLLPVLAERQTEHPRIANYVDTRDGRAQKLSDYVSRAEWHRRPIYHDFYKAVDVEDQITIMLPVPSPRIVVFGFNRDRRSFTDEDVALLDIVRPHLLQAYRNATAVSQLQAEADLTWQAMEQAGQAAIGLDPAGCVKASTSHAWRLLEIYFPEPRKSRSGLPETVARWVRQQLPLGTDDPPVPPQPWVVQGPEGQLTLRLIGEGEAGWMLLMEERVHTPANDWPVDGPLTDGLAPRYRRVLEHLLAGGSERQIAEQVGLSPHTVHTYVKRIYRHFGVRSRAQLLRLWMTAGGGA